MKEVTLPTGVHIRIKKIPDLLRDLVVLPLPSEYQAMRPVQFTPQTFSHSFLTPAELTRLNKFKALKKQVEWLCGRYSAKTLAKEMLMPERAENRIKIEYMEQGAPYLADFPDHCLSLSHSGIYTGAALTASPGITMGIDIEKMGPRPESAFMNMAFTQAEIQGMGSSAYDLFKAWTLKEAYLKYIQMGFNESLHQVEILNGQILHGGKKQNLDCQTWELEEGYLLSGIFPRGTKIHFPTVPGP